MAIVGDFKNRVDKPGGFRDRVKKPGGQYRVECNHLFSAGGSGFRDPGWREEEDAATTTALYVLPHAPQGGHKGTAGRVSGVAVHAKK